MAKVGKRFSDIFTKLTSLLQYLDESENTNGRLPECISDSQMLDLDEHI